VISSRVTIVGIIGLVPVEIVLRETHGLERSKQMAESQSVGTEAITAIIAAILALANALDKKSTLSFEEYRDALLSMYREMPHEDARGDAGHIFDGMLSQLTRAIRNRERHT
jgi:hypothetical protein